MNDLFGDIFEESATDDNIFTAARIFSFLRATVGLGSSNTDFGLSSTGDSKLSPSLAPKVSERLNVLIRNGIAGF